MILSNAKMSWLIFIIFSLWMLTIFKKNKCSLDNYLFYIFPVTCAFFILLGVEKGNFPESIFFEIISNRNGSEDLFTLQKISSVITFLLLIISEFFLIFKFRVL